MDSRTLSYIARIRTDFPTKFGVPRQSGLVEELEGLVVFEPPYRVPEAVRGLEQFSHIWLIWEFSQAVRKNWSPTVRPPRLGGNRRVGVFATRSPFRPNPIGLSSVRLTAVEQDPQLGPVLRVRGADLMDGTPIFDIKPYLPYGDCHPEAAGGFTDAVSRPTLRVSADPALLSPLTQRQRAALLGVLAQDPRPSYQQDPARVYGFGFGDWEVRFTVEGDTLSLRELLPRERPEQKKP